jgi:hypothetical protein
MRLRSKRIDARAADPAAYWRRRFFILGSGMAVIAVVAWQFTPARPARAPGSASTARSSMGARTPGALPSAAYGSAWPGPSPTTPQTNARASATAAQNAGASVAATSGTPRQGASAPALASGGQCAPAGVVLSLFTSQASYGPGNQPQFDVYAVSTAPGTCLMPFGPGSVRVIVTRHGQVVWDSATCRPASPSAAQVRFELGVPQLLTVSWNRAAAGPAGCAGSLPAGASGTFEAVAMSAGQDSSIRAFTLLR